MRLPSRLRLKESRDFAQVRALGQSHQGRCLAIGVRAVPGLAGFQFGLITTRRLGCAVVRNRVRRRLREIIRQDQAQLTPGIHLVMIARWRSAEASLDELRSDWRRIARRAGILRS